jgi:hypothetical protein
VHPRDREVGVRREVEESGEVGLPGHETGPVVRLAFGDFGDSPEHVAVSMLVDDARRAEVQQDQSEEQFHREESVRRGEPEAPPRRRDGDEEPEPSVESRRANRHGGRQRQDDRGGEKRDAEQPRETGEREPVGSYPARSRPAHVEDGVVVHSVDR